MFYMSIFIISNTPAITLCEISFSYISNVVLLLHTLAFHFVLSYVVVFEASIHFKRTCTHS